MAKVAALTTRLQDESPVVRWHAVIELGKLSAAAKGAVPALAGRLQDKEESVRWAAALALGAIGPDAREAAMAFARPPSLIRTPMYASLHLEPCSGSWPRAPAVSPDRPNGGKAGDAETLSATKARARLVLPWLRLAGKANPRRTVDPAAPNPENDRTPAPIRKENANS